MKIAIASDHAGWQIKEKVKKYLVSLKSRPLRPVSSHRRLSGLQSAIEIKDFGADSEDSVDYPDFGAKVARAVASGKFRYGILICGSGLGMCIVANKVKGIRAVNCYDKTTAKISRRHNDANILCLGARLLDMKQIKGIIKVWLNTPFEAGRHQRRIDKISRLESKN